MHAPTRHYRHIRKLPHLSEEEKQTLSRVEGEFAFRANDYYLQLIDWDDPDDPIRRLIIPTEGELRDWGTLDPSRESDYTVANGTQHKYTHTALILAAETCDSYCRYCFRKRLTMRRGEEVMNDVRGGIEYIRAHPEVDNVLLTGGDPLTLATNKLRRIIERLREIDHVGIIRIGTKVLAFNPYRILDDPKLIELIEAYSWREKRIYVMSHFAHPRELTEPAVEAVDRLLKAGAIIANQCPLIAGVNDDAEVLVELFNRLSMTGATPYYLFQGRPTKGNAIFEVPIVRASRIFNEAFEGTSGLGRRPRLTMSHHTGKIEIVGYDESQIYLRYHRAAHEENKGRFLICHRDDRAIWFDDLDVVHTFKPGTQETNVLSA